MKRIWLTRNLILLTIVSLAQDAASELLYPLLPILLTGVIGAAPLALGLIEGCAEAAAGFTKLISGKSSDRLGRKPFIISGYTLAGVGKAFVVVATSWPLVFLGRVTDRIGKGMRSAPRDALIADSVDKAMWALIPAIISGLLTLFIRENFVKPKKVEVKVKVKHPPLPAPLKKSITILVLIQLTNIPDALLLLRLYDIGFSTQGVVLSYMLFSAVTVLAAYPGGAIADKYSPRIVYSVGLIAFAAAYATLGLTQNHTVALIALVLYGLFPALTDGVGKAWIAGLSEANHRGRAQGVYQASMNFAILGAGIWGGALWSKGDIQWPLVVAAIGALIGAIVLATIHLRRARS